MFARLAIFLVLTAIATAAPKPNILFLLTEDQGAQAGFLGTPGIRTPHMDRLAKSGKVFRNAFVAYPVCAASKAAMSPAQIAHSTGPGDPTPTVPIHLEM